MEVYKMESNRKRAFSDNNEATMQLYAQSVKRKRIRNK